MNPTSRFARVDEEGFPLPDDLEFMGMAEDHDIRGGRGDQIVQTSVGMDEQEAKAAVLETEGGYPDFPEWSEGGSQARLLAVAVSIDGFDGGAEAGQDLGGERSHEISGVNDQVAAGFIKNADGPLDLGQVIVAVGKDADQGR